MGTITKRQIQSFCPEDLGTLLMIFVTDNEAPTGVATRVVELSVLVGLDNVLLEEILFFLRCHASSSIFMRYSWEDSFSGLDELWSRIYSHDGPEDVQVV